MIRRVFNNQTQTITASAYIVAISSLVSAILGLVRDGLLSWRLGGGEQLDIYLAAFRIPNFAFGLLVSGGIIAAFLPVLSEYFTRGEKNAWHFTNIVLNAFLFLLVFVCALLFIFTPWLIKFVVPGFNPENQAQTVTLTRIMFLSPIFFGLSNIFSGILQYFRRFLVYALSPIFYNLGIIFGILFLLPKFGLIGIAWGVILGAFLHWVIQIPAVFGTGFRYQLILNFFYPGLKKVFILMIPRTIGVAASHINIIIVTAIASTLGAGSISVFDLSDHLRALPIGIIGGSFAIAVFPFLAKNWTEGKKEKFLKNLSSTIRQILFLVIPLSLLIFLLRAQIVRLIYGRGEFDWQDTQLTTASLGLFCLSIFAYSIIPILARGFYSLHDTKTPLFVGIASISFNVVLAFFFVWLLKFPNFFQKTLLDLLDLEKVVQVVGMSSVAVIGLPLAISLSGIFQLSLLLFFLYKRVGDFRIREISLSILKIFGATFLMALPVFWTIQRTANFFDTHTALGLLFQTVGTVLVGVFTYFLAAKALKMSEMKILQSQFLLAFKKPKQFPPLSDVSQE